MKSRTERDKGRIEDEGGTDRRLIDHTVLVTLSTPHRFCCAPAAAMLRQIYFNFVAERTVKIVVDTFFLS